MNVLGDDTLRAQLFEELKRHEKAMAATLNTFDAFEGGTPVELKGSTAHVLLDDRGRVVYRFRSVNEGVAMETLAEMVYDRRKSLGSKDITPAMVVRRLRNRLRDMVRASDEFERRRVLEDGVETRRTVRRSTAWDHRGRHDDGRDSEPISETDGLEGSAARPGKESRNRTAIAAAHRGYTKDTAELAIKNVERRARFAELSDAQQLIVRVFWMTQCSAESVASMLNRAGWRVTAQDVEELFENSDPDQDALERVQAFFEGFKTPGDVERDLLLALRHLSGATPKAPREGVSGGRSGIGKGTSNEPDTVSDRRP